MISRVLVPGGLAKTAGRRTIARVQGVGTSSGAGRFERSTDTDRGLVRQSERDGDEATCLGLCDHGPRRVLVLSVGLQVDGLLDLDEPEAAVGPAADDAFSMDDEVAQR